MGEMTGVVGKSVRQRIIASGQAEAKSAVNSNYFLLDIFAKST